MQRVLSFPVTRGFGDSSEFVTKRMCFSFMFAIGFLALLSGFLLGRFAFDQELTHARNQMRKAVQRANQTLPSTNGSSSPPLAGTFTQPFTEHALQTHLSSLVEASHAAVNASLAQAVLLRAHFQRAGFELVSPLKPVLVPLAYPEPTQVNQAVILDGSGNAVLSCNDSRPSYSVAADAAHPVTLSSATIQGQPVYVNFGRYEDYLHLDAVGVDVTNHVVLARAGGLEARDLVASALEHGALAVLLYLDPQQTDLDPDLVPARDLAKMQPEPGTADDAGNAEHKAAPVLVISTADAEKILQLMAPREASPSNWRGALNCPYPLGPGFSEDAWSVQVQINTARIVHTSYDVVAALKGHQEPDLVVVAGVGSQDDVASGDRQLTGMATLMELAHQLGTLKTAKGWRPYRSVVVAFWGHGGVDARGILTSEAVAYLDMDLTALGAGNRSVRGSPLLAPLFDLAAFPAPSLDTLLPPGRATALDRTGVPFLQLQADGSVDDSVLSSLEQAGRLGAIWANVTLELASSRPVPFSLSPFVAFLNHTMAVINQRFAVVARRHKLFLETLTETVNKLVAAIRTFEATRRNTETTLTPTLQRNNLQLLEFARALACPRVAEPLPQRANILLTRHLLFSRSHTGGDATAGLGELQDLLRAMTSTTAPDDLQAQIVTLLNDAMRCLRNATDAFADRIDTLVMGDT